MTSALSGCIRNDACRIFIKSTPVRVDFVNYFCLLASLQNFMSKFFAATLLISTPALASAIGVKSLSINGIACSTVFLSHFFSDKKLLNSCRALRPLRNTAIRKKDVFYESAAVEFKAKSPADGRNIEVFPFGNFVRLDDNILFGFGIITVVISSSGLRTVLR